MTMFLLLLDSETHVLTYVNAGHVPCLFLPRDASDERLSRKKRKAKEHESEIEADESTLPGNVSAEIVRPRKRIAPLLGGGSVLGFGPDPQFAEKTLQLRHGDRFFLYTDGLTECANDQGQSINPARLRELLGEMASLGEGELRENFVTRMNAHFGNANLDDDITVVVVEMLDAPLEAPKGMPLFLHGAEGAT